MSTWRLHRSKTHVVNIEAGPLRFGCARFSRQKAVRQCREGAEGRCKASASVLDVHAVAQLGTRFQHVVVRLGACLLAHPLGNRGARPGCKPGVPLHVGFFGL